MVEIKLLVVIFCFKHVLSAMESYIVGGFKTDIKNYPHSVFINIHCFKKSTNAISWICGGSILNQKIILTAAHCLEGCLSHSVVQIYVGSENIHEAKVFNAESFLTHINYDADISAADIALVKISKRLQFNSKVKRVALMPNPPYNENAFVAGWGLIDEYEKQFSPYLKYIDQKVISRNDCNKLLRLVPEKCICGSSENHYQYPASGDSGSALIVRSYIQIGLVSFKIPDISDNMIVYTDVGKYYNWIRFNAKRLQCN